ncbi:hypothetical protein AQUCO_01400339v1 [Aquilegia coerulea]|uniref:Glucosidase 2 subunit beta n=1 Tax=Aquilegia coerulea TaxID=218851 RepID=A0A2G5DVX2_AQUCA|nr:hypothetical protein AQUCO_01400339v1 [Aquilegia coerulea]
MKKPHRRFSLYILLNLIYLIYIIESVTCSSPFSKDSLGISPEDVKYFKSEIIKCKDGSKKFTKAQLNDDFCDCLDGTDEPGTSACPGGKFYCRNAGHAPLTIFSSRVNDGICDCCDGSDEYDGRTNCTNTCWEAGKVARDKLKKKIATYEQGVTIRNHEVEQAKKAIAKHEEELSKLKNEEKILKKLVQQLKERKEQIEKAEEKERLEKEKEEKNKTDSEVKVDEQINSPTEKEDEGTDDTIGNLDDPTEEQALDDKDNIIAEDGTGHDDESQSSSSEAAKQQALDDEDNFMAEAETGHDTESKSSSSETVKQENDGAESSEGLSKEELGRLVASRWTGENADQKTKDVDDTTVEEHDASQSTQLNDHGEDSDGYSSEMDEDNRKYDDNKYDEDTMDDEEVEDEFEEEDHDDSTASYKPESDEQIDFSDITTTSSSSWLDKIQQTVRNILQSVNLFQTPVDKSEAAHVRKEYDDSNAKLSKIQSRISSLDERLKHDFGMEKEFYSFHNRCFENKQNKYVYKVCPFKQASQVEGHSTTQLGQWEKFEDSYRVMVFSNGNSCWNGPDRSLKVRLRCGLNNELTDVDEPSRCEYVALLSTPALCVEERLKELRHKLDRMNSEQPQSHDEL